MGMGMGARPNAVRPARRMRCPANSRPRQNLSGLTGNRSIVNTRSVARLHLRPPQRSRATSAGRRNSPVLVTGMRALIERRNPPSPNMIAIGSGGESGAPVGKVGFDLDEANPVARIVPDAPTGTAPLGPPYFGEFTVTLANREQQVFQVIANTAENDVEWTIELAIQVDGEERRFEVDNNGQPFRTSVRIHELSRYERVWYCDFEEGDLTECAKARSRYLPQRPIDERRAAASAHRREVLGGIRLTCRPNTITLRPDQLVLIERCLP
jgi:hypothetical protein